MVINRNLKTRNCIICKKTINIYNIKEGNKHKESKIFMRLCSEEGILYANRWFCNECYNKIMKNIKL
jgi:hypothetical protein